MKGLILAILLSLGCLVYLAVKYELTSYRYENSYGYMWDLADKSSTIVEKSRYISDFYSALYTNRTDFASNNAIWLKTPNNSFDKNLNAIKSLSDRLVTISKMEETSFEYQVAIEQITKQEQGEANELIYTIKGCYFLEQAPCLWKWIGGVIAISLILLIMSLVVVVILKVTIDGY